MSIESSPADNGSRLNSWEDYEKKLAVQVLTEVAKIRRDRGLTVKDLAELLADVGWPISVSSLNGMLGLNKRKSVSLGEIMAFARALKVPPIELLFPELIEVVHTLPGQTMHPLAAREEFSGDEGVTGELGNRLKQLASTVNETVEIFEMLDERRRKRREELRAFLIAAGKAKESQEARLRNLRDFLMNEDANEVRQEDAST